MGKLEDLRKIKLLNRKILQRFVLTFFEFHAEYIRIIAPFCAHVISLDEYSSSKNALFINLMSEPMYGERSRFIITLTSDILGDKI